MPDVGSKLKTNKERIMGRHKSKIKPPCLNRDKHTPSPDGYLHWQDWADEMSKTHKQIKCKSCGLFAIWVKK